MIAAAALFCSILLLTAKADPNTLLFDSGSQRLAGPCGYKDGKVMPASQTFQPPLLLLGPPFDSKVMGVSEERVRFSRDDVAVAAADSYSSLMFCRISSTRISASSQSRSSRAPRPKMTALRALAGGTSFGGYLLCLDSGVGATLDGRVRARGGYE